MSTQVPSRPSRAYLVPSDAHTPDEDILLVRSSAKNPIGSCFRGVAIPPGGLGYQTRANVEAFPLSTVLHPYAAPEVPAPKPSQAPAPAPAAPLADTEPPSPPERARVLSAREAVAFIEAAAPGEYEHLRADPRRSVKDAIIDRDMALAAAGAR